MSALRNYNLLKVTVRARLVLSELGPGNKSIIAGGSKEILGYAPEHVLLRKVRPITAYFGQG